MTLEKLPGCDRSKGESALVRGVPLEIAVHGSIVQLAGDDPEDLASQGLPTHLPRCQAVWLAVKHMEVRFVPSTHRLPALPAPRPLLVAATSKCVQRQSLTHGFEYNAKEAHSRRALNVFSTLPRPEPGMDQFAAHRDSIQPFLLSSLQDMVTGRVMR